MDLVKADLTGAPETMLATLYLRAQASRASNPILVDRVAQDAVERLDYDFAHLANRLNPASVAVRAKALDRWTQQELDAEPRMTVLHLACGLDSRAFRLDLPEGVEWYDIDFPEVIELRNRLFPEKKRVHTIASSVTDPHLLDSLPKDQPVLVVAEGLTMYLSEKDGLDLAGRIVRHFPRGTLIFDAFNDFGVRVSNRFNPVVVRAGAHLQWGIDDPHEVTRSVPGLVFDTEWLFIEAPEMARLHWTARALYRLLSKIPVLGRMGRMLRYRFDRS
jgi:O-methyltransferase involved in polyketide biosynthesis